MCIDLQAQAHLLSETQPHFLARTAANRPCTMIICVIIIPLIMTLHLSLPTYRFPKINMDYDQFVVANSPATIHDRMVAALASYKYAPDTDTGFEFPNVSAVPKFQPAAKTSVNNIQGLQSWLPTDVVEKFFPKREPLLREDKFELLAASRPVRSVAAQDQLLIVYKVSLVCVS